MTAQSVSEAAEPLGYMCPRCHSGSATPFRCGGPHSGRYDFVDAVPVERAERAASLRDALERLRQFADSQEDDDGFAWMLDVIDAALAAGSVGV